ncbi:hypothetical protein [Micromonospora sp. CPCC 205556]|uniref:hypothetical protein n=1 Tax=Micromonospora sp. CPCC 205556 TaxID=3122398 RepID=UPI002FF36C7D
MRDAVPTIRARWHDIADTADLVATSLRTSALGAWLVPQEDRRGAVLTAASRIWVEHALLFGEVFLLADRSAAAVWFHRYRPLPPPANYRQRLEAACGRHVDRFQTLDLILNAHRPTEAHNHLAFLAASSPARASALLAASLIRMDRVALPAYAEATTTVEAAIYTRHGYVARDPFALPDGTTVHPLWRVPSGHRAFPAVRSRNSRPQRPRKELRLTAT